MKYYALFLKKENNQYIRIGEKQFNPMDEFIHYENRTFLIDLKMVGYTGKENKIYFFDYNTEKIANEKGNLISYAGYLTFNEIKGFMSAEDQDIFLRRKIFQHLTSGLLNAVKTNWILILFVGVALFFVGYVVCGFINPSHHYIAHLLPNGTIITEQTDFILSKVFLK